MRVVDTYPDPQFYDFFVAKTNIDLSALGWIQYIHPIAQIGEDEQGTFPEVYRNDGSHYSERIMPHGNSISFWELNDPISMIDESGFFNAEMSLIVWADLTKVYPNKDFNYTTELLNDVIGVLEKNSAYNIQIRLQDVFDNYSQLEKLTNQNVMLPYTAFKITFNADIKRCNADNEGLYFLMNEDGTPLQNEDDNNLING